MQILHNFAMQKMQMQILQMQKMQKLFCINTKNNAKHAKTRARAAGQKTGENQRKISRKTGKTRRQPAEQMTSKLDLMA